MGAHIVVEHIQSFFFKYVIPCVGFFLKVFDRPGVAQAVLQTASSLIH